MDSEQRKQQRDEIGRALANQAERVADAVGVWAACSPILDGDWRYEVTFRPRFTESPPASVRLGEATAQFVAVLHPQFGDTAALVGEPVEAPGGSVTLTIKIAAPGDVPE
jgi:hypothetical protein